MEAAASSELFIREDGKPLCEKEKIRTALEEPLELSLRRLATATGTSTMAVYE